MPNSLGGRNEIAGGLWVLLVSAAAQQIAALPRTVNYLGLAVGAAGLVTVVPALEGAGAVVGLGLGLVIWFAWVDGTMVRGAAAGAARPARSVEAHR